MKRHRKIFIIILFSLVCNFAYAQLYSIGFKSGINFSNIIAEYEDDFSYKTGINSGLMLEIDYNKGLALFLELNYEQKGYRYEDTTGLDDNFFYTGMKSYDYISIPFMIKYSYGKKLKTSISGGIYLAFLVLAIDKGETINYSSSPPNKTTFSNSILSKTTNWDIGYSLGLSLEYILNERWKIMIENRLNSGMMFLDPEKIYIEEYLNLSSSITFGIVFSINKKSKD